jgi:hypothetical protein
MKGIIIGTVIYAVIGFIYATLLWFINGGFIIETNGNFSMFYILSMLGSVTFYIFRNENLLIKTASEKVG